MPAETHSSGEVLTREEVRLVVCGAIVECCGGDIDEFTDQSTLVSLGVDDVVRLDLADILSEELGERNLVGVFDGEEFADVESVGALVDLIMGEPNDV